MSYSYCYCCVTVFNQRPSLLLLCDCSSSPTITVTATWLFLITCHYFYCCVTVFITYHYCQCCVTVFHHLPLQSLVCDCFPSATITVTAAWLFLITYQYCHCCDCFWSVTITVTAVQLFSHGQSRLLPMSAATLTAVFGKWSCLCLCALCVGHLQCIVVFFVFFQWSW